MEVKVGDWVRWNYNMLFDEIGEVMSIEEAVVGRYYVVSGRPVHEKDILEVRKPISNEG